MEKKRGPGQPTKYNEGMIDRVHEYVESREGTMELPTIEGFAVYVDVSRDVIYEWTGKHKKFFYTIKKLLTKQSSILQSGVYYNSGNVTGGIFLLKNNHGFKDKNETDLTSGGKPIQSLLNGLSKLHENKGTGSKV